MIKVGDVQVGDLVEFYDQERFKVLIVSLVDAKEVSIKYANTKNRSDFYGLNLDTMQIESFGIVPSTESYWTRISRA